MTTPLKDVTDRLASPWHEGEIALQARLGVVEKMDEMGRRNLRPFLTDQHRSFYPQLPMIAAGVVTPDGHPWATLLAGKPGFLASPTPQTLHIETRPARCDPAAVGFFEGSALGLLGIDLSTRRRNRLNGTLRLTDGAFDVDVEQSFGNCDRYIQKRVLEFASVSPAEQTSASPPEIGTELTERARILISASDTFFVASFIKRGEGVRQVDVAHRGGRAGFVRIDAAGTLTVPDFSGNMYFNTLGNFIVNPKAGLLFCDFESGDMLQLSGSVEIIFDSPEIDAFQGAQRLWRFTPERVVFRERASPVIFKADSHQWSPATLMTDDWKVVALRQSAGALGASWRPFNVVRIDKESSVITSFHLQPVDGAGLLRYRAGQSLPIRIRTSASAAPLVRRYTLSTAANADSYRISVRLDGAVSRHLHENLALGDLIEASAPCGAFTIDALERRPVVLISAGVGVTPMLAMLHEVVCEGIRARRTRSTWFFHAARSRAERAFDDEVAELAKKAGNAVKVFRSLVDVTGALVGEHYDIEGRLSVEFLKSRLPFDDYDFYLCGPIDFMRTVSDALRALCVSEVRIHSESFGDSALRHGSAETSALITAKKATAAATYPVPVVFLASGKEALWKPGSGTLLHFAERHGQTPTFGCREGVCGMCKASVNEGNVTYETAPSFEVEEGKVLLCCAVPASGIQRLVLDI